jgi:hypothetical protein
MNRRIITFTLTLLMALQAVHVSTMQAIPVLSPFVDFVSGSLTDQAKDRVKTAGLTTLIVCAAIYYRNIWAALQETNHAFIAPFTNNINIDPWGVIRDVSNINFLDSFAAIKNGLLYATRS